MYIFDPSDLTDGLEITITVGTKLIKLNKDVSGGNLTDEGVTIKCVYSKLKELWKTDPIYIKYPFPMIPIHDEQFEVVNGWDWEDDETRYLLRNGGWALYNAGGDLMEKWAGIIGLGSLTAGSQVYMQQGSTENAVNFQLTDQINQAIQIYQAGSGGFNYDSYLKLFCREWGKTYAFSQLSDIGVTTLTYQAYRFPLANASDPKITHAESFVNGANEPYNLMKIEWFTANQVRSIGGVNYNFHTIIGETQSGVDGTAEQIYEFVQAQLRKNSDIDAGAGSKIGKVTSSLLRFVGDTLYTIDIDPSVTEGGCFIDIYQDVDINRLVFVDETGTERIFPYLAVLTINFGDNLKNDAEAKFWVFFTNDDSGLNLGYDYGTSNAIIVQDDQEVDMVYNVSSLSSKTVKFAYDANVQRGNELPNESPADDAPITVVAIGLATGQFVKATGNIARSVANVVSLIAPLERNYSNPI